MALERYDLLRELGRGGMAVVLLARQRDMQRLVALKELGGFNQGDPAFVERFLREAQLAGSLTHANIVTVYDSFDESGTPYIAMELMDGGSLRPLVGEMTLPQVAGALEGLLAGVGHAGAQGIVHRDLKPENVFITRDGRVKILDFGLATLRGDPNPSALGAKSATASEITGAGSILGSAGYMSPEQVRGLPADHRSDIFAFGALLYEMLSGRRAFRAESAVETMNAILKEEPPDLSSIARGVPPLLDRIVRHCLEKQPEDRFQSARDVAFALEASAQDTRSGWPPQGRRPRLAAMVGALVLGLLAVGGAVRFWFGHGIWDSRRRAPMTIVPVTSLSGWELNPAFSPDGTHLAFSWDGGGRNQDIYVQLIGAGTPLRLTTDPADDQSPTWSPDGRYIAFMRSVTDGEQGVFTVPSRAVRRGA